MNLFEAVILGLLQGLAEFLPISSSGHLVLFQKILHIDEPSMTFDILLHLGTLIPIFIVFRDDLLSIIKKPFQKLTYMLIIATLPTVIVALLFKDSIEAMFETGRFLSVSFIITGVLLLYADKIPSADRKDDNLSALDAIIIGIMQAVAITPGISRSGSTIAGGLFRRLDKVFAAKFAFLMSIPAVLGALVLEIKDVITDGVPLENIFSAPYFFGILTAAFSGYVAIKFMMELVNKSKLKYFSYYVIALGALILIDQFVFNLYFPPLF